MASFIITSTCGNCGNCEQCGAPALFTHQLRQDMAAAQRATMTDRVTYLRYGVKRDQCTGQDAADPYAEFATCCGIDAATGNGRASTNAREIGTPHELSTRHYRSIRLPLSPFAAIDPDHRSRYVVTHEKGMPMIYHKEFEQIGGAEIGQTAVVVRVREVIA